MLSSILIITTLSLVFAEKNLFPTWINPNLGWYTFYYTGLQQAHFRLKAHKVLQLTATGCNCPGDQFQLLDNGHPMILFGGCSTYPTGPCTSPVTDPRICSDPSSGSKMMSKISGNGPKSFAFDNNGFCVLGGILLPGEHNITLIATTSNYPANLAFIRADTWCLEEQIPCCFVEEQLLSQPVCVDAVIG